MAGYVISGNIDEACAKLKDSLKASDAGFDANLKAMFKSPPPPARKPVAPAPAFAPSPMAGSSFSLTRNRDDSSAMRSRLRSSLRSISR